MIMVFVLVLLAVLGLLAGVHWYLWRRLVRDTTAPGGAGRRIGTAAAFVLPLTTVGALMSGRVGAPFAVEQAFAWPGYLWLATMLYLAFALLAGEAVRPLLRRWLAARDAAAQDRAGGQDGTGEQDQAPARDDAAAPVRAAAPAPGARDRTSVPAGGPTTGATSASASPGSGSTAGSAPAAASAVPAAVTASGATSSDADAPRGAAAPGTGGTAAGALAPGAGQAGGAAVLDAEEPVTAAEAAATSPQAAAVTGPAAATEPTEPTEPTAKPTEPAESAEPAEPDGRAAGTGRAEPGRRLFIARTVAVAASAVGLGTVGHGAYDVLNGPAVKRVTVPLAKLPRSAHGYRIAVVSDIHLGPILGRSHTRRIVDVINRVQPDLVAIVGDLVDGSVADLGPAAEPLADLRSRHGTYFVTGNHEYFSGAAEWVDFVRELGVHPLENARVELPGFDLAGVNDISAEGAGTVGQGPDFRRALGGRDRSRASVLLAHQPVVIHDAMDHGVDLQLSGHTHGGQLWPGNHLAALANPTVAGLERYGDTQLYVTRGAGTWGPPVRVGAESDITVVTLASKQT